MLSVYKHQILNHVSPYHSSTYVQGKDILLVKNNHLSSRLTSWLIKDDPTGIVISMDKEYCQHSNMMDSIDIGITVQGPRNAKVDSAI